MKPLLLAALLLASDGGTPDLWRTYADWSDQNADHWRAEALRLSDENADLALALWRCERRTP